MEDMAKHRRTTVVIAAEDERALRIASRAEGVSQSELIRRGIRTVTAAYRGARPRPRTGLFKATKKERENLLYGPDEFGDADASRRARSDSTRNRGFSPETA